MPTSDSRLAPSNTPAPYHFPKFPMRSKIIFTTVVVLALLLGGVILFLGLQSPVASAGRDYGEEASSWIHSIKQGSKSWEEQKLVEESAQKRRLELETTIGGLRAALCSRYQIVVEGDSEYRREDCEDFR
jgi:hypothetical protein